MHAMARTYYEIRYYDTLDEGAATVVHDARRGSVRLNYNGDEEKIQDIIGSVLYLEVFDKEALDGKFKDFYTADETRWRVEVWYVDIIQPDRTRIFWQGFIMPEQYEEPYKAGNIPVKVTATDGLGRLKGKYLDDAYYEDEYTVMQFITACLLKTGNAFETYFSPAIINYHKKQWDEINKSGARFMDGDDKLDCYDILQSLLQDMLCVVYQEWATWFVVGVNKLAVPELIYVRYNTTGGVIDKALGVRTPYDVAGLVLKSPTVGVVTPYKNIEVSSPVKEISLSPELSEKTRDGWVLPAPLDIVNVGERLLFREWLVEGYSTVSGNTFWTPIVRPADGILNLGYPKGSTFYDSKYVRLARKLFVTAGQKLKLDFSFEHPREEGKNTRILFEIRIDDLDGHEQVISREVRFDENTIPEEQEFEDYLTAEFVVQHNGYLDVRIYKPTISGTTLATMRLETLELEHIGYEEVETFTSVINDDYSTEVAVELAYGDDMSGCGWRLEKLDEQSVDLYAKGLDIKSVFTFDNEPYVVLDLRELFFVKDFPDFIEVQQGGSGAFVPVPVGEVTYNFFNGEQMVFTYDATALGFTIAASDVLRCLVKDYNYPAGDRATWREWVDDVYQILPKRYGEVVAQVYRNLYKDPHNTLDIDLLGIYGMSALIAFHYIDDKVFYPLNVSLDLGQGRTSGFYSEAFYGAPSSGNIPPIVDAGPDQELTDTQSTATLQATESDPDGTIVTRLWEVITGTATINAPTALETTLSGLVDDEITLRITVTDDDGASASDEITLSRKRDYAIDNTILVNNNTADATGQTVERKEQLAFTPVIPAGQVLTLEHTVRLETTNDAAGANSNVFFECLKNGQLVAQAVDDTVMSFSVSYIDGDVITYEVTSDSQSESGEGSTSGISRVVIGIVTFQNALGSVTNDPYSIQAASSANS